MSRLTLSGPLERVAILTLGLDPCACYLTRQWQSQSFDVRVFSQASAGLSEGSWPYYRRLWKRHGSGAALDNAVFHGTRWVEQFPHRVVRKIRRSLGYTHPPSQSSAFPVLSAEPVPCVSITDINRSPDLDALRAYAPDLLVLAGSPILRAPVLEIPRLATLNAHCGISPDFGGNSPVMWAVSLRRWNDIGYTVHAVTPTVDGGPVLMQRRVPIDPWLSVPNMWPVLAQLMYDALSNVVLRLHAGDTLSATPHTEPVTVRPPAGWLTRRRASKALLEERRRQLTPGWEW